MDIRPLTETYAVSPQITPEDMADIKAAGFALVIDNRPDAEVGPELSSDAMAAAAAAAGLAFIANPFAPTAFSMDLVVAQAEAIGGAKGPVLAYCASGNRSSVLWAMTQAQAGADPEALIAAAAQHGYDLSGLAPQLAKLGEG